MQAQSYSRTYSVGKCRVYRRDVVFEDVGPGWDGLAALTLANAQHARSLGASRFYANPGHLVIPDDTATEAEFNAAASRSWHLWLKALTRGLGGGRAVKRRALRQTSKDRAARLAWRGLAVLHGPGETSGPVETSSPAETSSPVEPAWSLTGSYRTFEDEQTGKARRVRRAQQTGPIGHAVEGRNGMEGRVPLWAPGVDPEAPGVEPIGYARADQATIDGTLAAWCWEVDADGYAVARGTGGRVRLHELVMGGPAPRGYVIDHINRDRLDDRRSNLDVVTHEQSARNRGVRSDSASGIKGVKQLPDGRWRLRYTDGGKRVDRYFRSREDAAAASAAWFGG